MTQQKILQQGRNCWRIRRAERFAFLIDGDAYFSALHSALQQANEEIMILSWDIYSDLKPGAMQGDKRSLITILNDSLEDNEDLQANILNWDYSMLFATSREWLPAYKIDWKTNDRLKFRLDKEHPIGSSHHQKVVTIDNQLAFAGGIDLTRGRWDTPDHKSNDERRLAIDGTKGRPHHDVQVMFEGDAASAITDMANERWRRATGEKREKPDSDHSSPWPDDFEPDLTDVDVAISRTLPGYDDYEEVREVEQLYIDAINAAQDYIYIENQYFTCPVISEALAKRLSEDNGPEVIINLPLETDGWLAQNSMDVIRFKLIKQLQEADKHGRLGVYYPYNYDAREIPINLHAKVMIVDDRFVRVGSSNINNRSMGLDTECDISIECHPDDRQTVKGIQHFRDRLLAEHLSVSEEYVCSVVKQRSSMLNAIRAMRSQGGKRTMKELKTGLSQKEMSLLTDSELVDPEKPVELDKFMASHLQYEDENDSGLNIKNWLMALAGLVILSLIWRFSPLGETIDVESLFRAIEDVKHNTLAPLFILAGFVVSSLLMIPLTLLIIAVVIVYGTLIGGLYALGGTLISSAVAYYIGSRISKASLKKIARGKISRISKKLAKRGIMTVALVRVVPVAPFTIINIVAGASHIKLRDFLMGTLIGILPGISVIALLTTTVKETVVTPQSSTVFIASIVALFFIFMGYLFLKLKNNWST